MRIQGSEDVWRRETPAVLAALFHRYGDFAACEDAVQDALIESSRQWSETGVPEHPRGWLITAASRRYIDQLRRESARRNREQRVFDAGAYEHVDDPRRYIEVEDSTLEMLTLCCHPKLTAESQVTLILRAVLGLTTKQIAGLYLIPPSTAGQRISRAKATIDDSGRCFPASDSANERLPAVLHALYLLYTAGHASPSGEGTEQRDLIREDLTSEAIRLARLLRHQCGDDGETGGLLALLLITEARRPARLDQEGEVVPLKNQDRARWNRDAITEGTQILEAVLPSGRVGPYQLQAAIAAVHAEAPTWTDTDWKQIVELYQMLSRVAPSPTVTMNFAVAINEVNGAEAALAMLEPLNRDQRMSRNHRLYASRAQILEDVGKLEEAAADYRKASSLCTNIPEQRFINAAIARVASNTRRPD